MYKASNYKANPAPQVLHLFQKTTTTTAVIQIVAGTKAMFLKVNYKFSLLITAWILANHSLWIHCLITVCFLVHIQYKDMEDYRMFH